MITFKNLEMYYLNDKLLRVASILMCSALVVNVYDNFANTSLGFQIMANKDPSIDEAMRLVLQSSWYIPQKLID